ncbi:MAG TPA: hypothetical protein VF591_03870, partial [Pyrinomonadaceae bacterium]
MKTALLILVTLLSASAAPQGDAGRYSKEGLAFEYPAGWTLADTSNGELQRVLLVFAPVLILIGVL